MNRVCNMYDKHKIQEKYDEIANDILDISRDTLLVNLRFMDMALSYHTREASTNICSSLASNGKSLFYNPYNVIKEYSQGSNEIIRSYLHTIFHCIYQHQFVNPGINKAYWDLACDIAVENTINDISIVVRDEL